MKDIANSIESSGKVIFHADKGAKAGIEIQLEKETVWLTLNNLAELFSTTKQVISYHLTRIYKQSELN